MGHITVTSIRANELLLSVDGELFELLTSSIEPPRRISGWIESFLSCGSFKHNVGIEGIDKQTTRKRTTRKQMW